MSLPVCVKQDTGAQNEFTWQHVVAL